MTTRSYVRRYSDLITFQTFEERFNYLQLHGKVGEDTFGFERYLNQTFYRSERWKRIRREVILRDNACDLGMDDRPILGLNEADRRYNFVVIHHMNPITKDDVIEMSPFLVDPQYLICCTDRTHRAIHYGNEENLIRDPIIRRPNDTKLW